MKNNVKLDMKKFSLSAVIRNYYSHHLLPSLSNILFENNKPRLRSLYAAITACAYLWVIHFFASFGTTILYSLMVLITIIGTVIWGIGPTFLFIIISVLGIDFFLINHFYMLSKFSLIIEHLIIYSSVSGIVHLIICTSHYFCQLSQERVIEQLNQRKKKDFILSTISHDLRSPLNVIIGYLELIKMNSPSPEILTKQLGFIEVAARNMLELADDLVDRDANDDGKIIIQKENSILT